MSEERNQESRRSDNYRGGRNSGYGGRGRGRNNRGGGGGFRGRRPPRRDPHEDERIQRLIRNAQDMLVDSTQAVCLEDLNAYERKRVHQFYDRKDDYETKTYRNGEEYLLWIFPVGKLRQYALDQAQSSLETGEQINLPPMSNYERFIVHDALKDIESIETNSFGEDDERHIRITPVRFGRKIKKIVKKLKLF